MSTKYQFPCPACNFVFELSTTQAGQELNCPSCEHVAEAPKLGVMKSLPVVGGEGHGGRPKVKKRNNILTTLALGAAILLGGAGAFLYNYGDSMITEFDVEEGLDEFDKVVDEAAPELIVALYGQLLRDEGLGEWQEQSVIRYNRQGSILKNTAYGLLGLSGVSLLVFLGTLFTKS